MRKTRRLRATALALGLALGGGFASPRAFALSVPPAASAADMAAEGTETERLTGYAKMLLAQGTSSGNLTESLLRAGFASFHVVEGVPVETVVHSAATFKGDDVQAAADDLVREVAARVFICSGALRTPRSPAGSPQGPAGPGRPCAGFGPDSARPLGRRVGPPPGTLGGEVDLLPQQAESVAAAAGAWRQTHTASGGSASAR